MWGHQRTIGRFRASKFVGWIEPFAKPIAVVSNSDGYRFAPPILRPNEPIWSAGPGFINGPSVAFDLVPLILESWHFFGLQVLSKNPHIAA
jgi:hypothetical protein